MLVDILIGYNLNIKEENASLRLGCRQACRVSSDSQNVPQVLR